MSAYEIALCVVAVAFSTAGVASPPAHRRGEHTFWAEETPVWWLWGDRAGRGWIRSGPALVVGLAVAHYSLPFGLRPRAAIPPRLR